MQTKRYLLAALVAFQFCACQNEGKLPKSGATLAKVNGEAITEGEINAVLTRLPERARPQFQTPQGRQQLVDSLINNELLFQEARRRGIPKKPEVMFQIESTKRSVYAKYLFDELVEERTRDEALKKIYETDQKYRLPEVKASHILVKDPKLANKIYKELKGGADFGELAKKYSEDTSNKDKGGDLGWFDQEHMVKPFSDAAFALKKGEISQPVASTFGYHIIKLEDRREQASFEDVKEKIRRDVSRPLQGEIMADLKKKAKIEYTSAPAQPGVPPPGIPPQSMGAGSSAPRVIMSPAPAGGTK